VVGLTRSVAASYGGDNVRCNAVAPGAVDTGIAIGGEPSPRGYATLQKTLGANPRLAAPEEIAEVVAFLASPAASFLNGAVVIADGGWTVY
jgi:NAD(P)-dependent dehydrogenase (short-subunit alcohol dehydrogenase family)